MSYIYHMMDNDQWRIAQEKGFYAPESLKVEGFIHFSKIDQILRVANSFYKGMSELIILKVDCDKLEAQIKIEPPLEDPEGSELFPHLYGRLNLDAVQEVIDFPCGEDGMFELPKKIGD